MKEFLRTCLLPIWKMLPYTWRQNFLFYRMYGHLPNRESPKIMDEKLLVLKDIYGKRTDVSMLTDKYEVRNYLQKKGYGSILNELYQVCDSAEQIDWDSLPERYAIKCNHGCCWNIIVDGKGVVDRKKASEQLNGWLSEDYSKRANEMQYKAIKPKIIIEKYLETADGHFPPDYKFFVSWGGVIGCLVATERDVKVKRIFVDTSFEDTHYIHEYEKEDYKKYKPKSWEKMLRIAAELGRDFPLVRVDLYDSDGEVIFGELTFTPNGCIHDEISLEGQCYIGDRIHLKREES